MLGELDSTLTAYAFTWAKVDGEWRVLSDAGGENVAAPTT